MRGLSFILIALLLLLGAGISQTEHPHGGDFNMNCGICHSPQGWKLDLAVYSYDHDSVYELKGSHAELTCGQCHSSLIFKDVDNQCFQCHQDVHQQSLGMNCERCHTNQTWLITGITNIHQDSRFPLLGAHRLADCEQCHINSNPFVFEPLSVECYACHQPEYAQTSQPNHLVSGFSEDCSECHTVFTPNWEGSFNHHFFPLDQAHHLPECTDCHNPTDYTGLQSECISCHELDYNLATEPNHVQAEFGTDCAMCHSLNPGWRPSIFDHDSDEFPIFSGHHDGEWNSCSDCHTNGDYHSVNCLECHEHNQDETDRRHDGVLFYKYDSDRCLFCHPNA